MTWGKPFESGKSGNPNGRPKKGTSLSEEIQKALARRARGAPDQPPTSRRAVIAETVLRLAEQGNIAALEILLDRTEGKVPQQTQTNANVRQLTEVRVVFGNDGD